MWSLFLQAGAGRFEFPTSRAPELKPFWSGIGFRTTNKKIGEGNMAFYFFFAKKRILSRKVSISKRVCLFFLQDILCSIKVHSKFGWCAVLLLFKNSIEIGDVVETALKANFSNTFIAFN